MFGTGALMTPIFRCGTTAYTYLHRVSARIGAFFVRCDLPDAASIARAFETQQAERKFYNVDEDGHVRRQTGLSEILRASQASAKVVHFADRRRQKLAAALTEECAPITGGPAFTFKQGGK